MKRTAREIARLSAEARWSRNPASQALGMAIESVAPGRAVLSLRVAANMVDGHGFCHGGSIFALADSAFAFACHSRSERQRARHCHICYLAGRLGVRLIAAARERQRTQRNGVYEVTVRDDRGETIAEFRGHSRSVPRALAP